MEKMRADQCTAMSRGSGERCKRKAIRGGTVCRSHGAQFPVVREAAARRVRLHQLIQATPMRPPWAVLIDATHKLDVMMQLAQTELAEDESLDARDRFVMRVKDAAMMARSVIDAGAVQMLFEKEVRQGELVANTLVRALSAIEERGGLAEDQLDAVRAIMRVELEAALAEDDTAGSGRPAIEGRAA